MQSETIRRIIRAYHDPIVRAYSWARFGILHQRFLDAIEEGLPDSGEILDIGCGFGLFSLYYAAVNPGRRIHGIDLNPRRISMAKRAAAELGLDNVSYDVKDVRDLKHEGPFAAAYMLDVIHHLPRQRVTPLLTHLRRALPVSGILVVKDVDTRPALKRWFTWALDKAMDPRTPVSYWSAEELSAALAEVGFEVTHEPLPDFLPYPHVIYRCLAVDRETLS